MENKKKGKINRDPATVPTKGVVFLYSSWSESEIFLKYLISILETFPLLDLYVYDVDNANTNNFIEFYNLQSKGMGETFWLHDGIIISQILNYRLENDNQALVYTKLLQEKNRD